MDAILLTGGLLLLMLGALLVLAKTWPRSSRRTGYRLDHPGERPGYPSRQEEDEVRFHFPDGKDGPGPD